MTLTVFGLIETAYILGGQIKDIKGDLKEMKHDIRGLIRRQTELKMQNIA